MSLKVIKNATIVNEGRFFLGDVVVNNDRIERVAEEGLSEQDLDQNAEIIDATGMYLLPGMIDDQVHFREPGLTHKAEIRTESRAAVAGGITSFMEMPNTNPQTVTQERLAEKFAVAAACSPANYSFFMGATNDNLDELLATDKQHVCGIKIFMGSSTGNMLVDDHATLENIFGKTGLLIATHCEDEQTIRNNSAAYKERFGDDVPWRHHPDIRSTEACYLSSSFAVELAKKHDTRLHILHISSERETYLFRNDIPLKDKRITAEACIHHLWFTDADYDAKGANIKWNPAVKTAEDRDGVWKAVLDNRIDIIATDHAPHTIEEKSGNYWTAPSGGPLVQHALVALFELMEQGRIPLERIAEKAAHSVAECFQLRERGYIREGYKADLVLVAKSGWTVSKDNLLYKCGWSPFEGQEFQYRIDKTFVNGTCVYKDGQVQEVLAGEALTFSR